MTDRADDSYNNANRAFLQAFIARSTLTFDEAKPIIASILDIHEKSGYLVEDVTEADFNNFVAAANFAISPFDLEIRSTFHQITRKRVYCLINSTSDDLTQMATIRSPDEINFLKRVLDAMFETYNTSRHEIMAITSMQAVALAKAPTANGRGETQSGTETQGSSGQGLTMMQAEKMLKNLVEEGWFEKSRKGYYSLSPRALMELRGWLNETYNEVEDDEEEEEGEGKRIKPCFGCKEVITTGQRCARRDCQCRLHDICTQQFFRSQDSRRCPLCKTAWTGNDFVGERAAPGGKEQPKKRRNGLGNEGSSARRQSPLAIPDEREDNEPMGEHDED